MFDIGFWELIILGGIGLIVLGPERLPKVAMQVGNWAGQARRMARQLTTQMRAELDTDITQPFTPGYSPNKSTDYQRPGVDDLKPGASEQNNDSSESDPTPDSPASENSKDTADAAGERQ